MSFKPVHHNDFLVSYAKALRHNANAAKACIPLHQVCLLSARCYLGNAHCDAVSYTSSGFVVKANGELCYIHANERGQGDAIVQAAIKVGAKHLDCFDGYLVQLYRRNGFVVTARTPNYTKGGPDEVFMELAYDLPSGGLSLYR
jgi:hypothetical protein